MQNSSKLLLRLSFPSYGYCPMCLAVVFEIFYFAVVMALSEDPGLCWLFLENGERFLRDEGQDNP